MNIAQYIQDYGDSHIILMYNSFKTNYPKYSDSIIIHKMLKLYLRDIEFQAGLQELINISLRRAQFCNNLLEQYIEK